MRRIEFRFGDALPADDPLARWIVKLGMVHNDLVFANLKFLAADDILAAEEKTVEWFFWHRMTIAYYHEAMTTLKEEQNIKEVEAFVASLPQEARTLHDEALAIHKKIVSSTSRLRNQATFHYPGKKARRALKASLQDIVDKTGTIEFGESNKVKDVRFAYADDVVETLYRRVFGNDADKMKEFIKQIGQGEKRLMEFINYAQDEFFTRLHQKKQADPA